MTHLNFTQDLSRTGKTKVITIKSLHDNTYLGKISWSGRWRQYVFCPNMDTETQWSWDCLVELQNFMIELNKERKQKTQ